jgi:hypothetical protein
MLATTLAVIGTRDDRGRRSWRAYPKYGITALMRSAEARLRASTMISNSIRFSLVGAQVLCTTNTSRARTFWLISTVTSPSENRPTVAAPSDMPRWRAMSAAMRGFALPVKTMKSGG